MRQHSYNLLDVEEYEILGTLDSITCDECGGYDGKHFKREDMQAGINAPPFHPNCRCTTIPYFDDEFTEGEERAARNLETGKTEYVESMTYEEWKEKYVGSYSMAATNGVDWSGTTAIPHTKAELQELKSYAESKNMQIFSEKLFDGDTELFKEQIDVIRNTLDEYNITDKITLQFEHMDNGDFAKTTGKGTITFDPRAFRSREYTNNILNEDNFLAAKDTLGIGAHECGHIISKKYGEKGLEIAKEAYYNIHKERISDTEMLLYLHKNVSIYSATTVPKEMKAPINPKRYKEVVPEILAKNLTNASDFSEEFIRLLKEVIL